MPVASPNELPVRWDFSVQPDGTAKLAFSGELDADSTAASWTRLEAELAGTKLARLEVDVSQLVSDSAGLALLYYLTTGGMTPGTTVSLSGLNPELQHLLRSFSREDFDALQEHEPTCSKEERRGTAAV